MTRLVTLSMGMGVDSAALMTRWLLDPSSRDFELSDLVVVTAMTGDESEATREAMELHLLPLMRAHGVRFVQVARAGWSETDGIEILSDSRMTELMVMRGKVSLSESMFRAGTIPQLSNRNCSYQFKGWVLDTWAQAEYAGVERRHVVGFAAEETSRRDKDEGYSRATPGKLPMYPLIDWGWDREACLAYLWEVYGFEWPRSCCGFCPFQAGPDIAKLGQRWTREPGQVLTAVRMEANALALNPRMKLFGVLSAADVARSFGLTHIVDQADAARDDGPAALYEVRRVYRRAGDQRAKNGKGWVLGPDPSKKATKGSAVWRSLRRLESGSRTAVVASLLTRHAALRGEAAQRAELEIRDGMALLWLQRASAPYPSTEHYLAIAVDGLDDKERGSFSELWQYVKRLDVPIQLSMFDSKPELLV